MILRPLSVATPDGYLAAVGLLRLVSLVDRSARLAWRDDHAAELTTDVDLAGLMLAESRRATAWWRDLPSDFGDYAEWAAVAASCAADRRRSDWLAGLGSMTTAGEWRPTMLRMAFGREAFVLGLQRAAERCTAERIAAWIDAPCPQYPDAHGMMGLSPDAYIPAALGATAPAKDPRGNSVTLWLIGEALALYPVAPGGDTAGWHWADGELQFRWPSWTAPRSLDWLRSIASSSWIMEPDQWRWITEDSDEGEESPGPNRYQPASALRAQGVTHVWRSTRQQRGHHPTGLLSPAVQEW